MSNIIDAKYSFVSQKHIADKATGKTSSFVVVATPTFDKQDWLSFKKLSDISIRMADLPLEYPLKTTIKGNPDEGRKAQEGKALKLAIEKDVYCLEIYTQNFGEGWKLSHTHFIEKRVFDAYVTVVTNDHLVAEREKKQKSPENFSLNLG